MSKANNEKFNHLRRTIETHTNFKRVDDTVALAIIQTIANR